MVPARCNCFVYIRASQPWHYWHFCWIILHWGWGLLSMHFKTFSSIPCFYPRDASSTFQSFLKNVYIKCPWGERRAKSLLLENHCPIMTFTKTKDKLSQKPSMCTLNLYMVLKSLALYLKLCSCILYGSRHYSSN